MQILVKKMEKMGLLKAELIIGMVIMLLAVVGIPLAMALYDVNLLLNPYVLGVVLVAMLCFAMVGYFCFMRPYIKYHKCPTVQAETDGEFLYIHTKKEAKIPLSTLTQANVRVELPFLYQKEFLREFIVHLFSSEYGTVVLEIHSYGTFKMPFVAKAQDTANELYNFIDKTINNTINNA